MESRYVVEDGVLQVRGYSALFEKRSETAEGVTCECGWTGTVSDLTEDGECPKCHAVIDDEDESDTK